MRRKELKKNKKQRAIVRENKCVVFLSAPRSSLPQPSNHHFKHTQTHQNTSKTRPKHGSVRTRDPQDLFLDILKIEDQERRGNFYHSKRTESLQQTLDKVLAVWKEEVPVRCVPFPVL